MDKMIREGRRTRRSRETPVRETVWETRRQLVKHKHTSTHTIKERMKKRVNTQHNVFSSSSNGHCPLYHHHHHHDQVIGALWWWALSIIDKLGRWKLQWWWRWRRRRLQNTAAENNTRLKSVEVRFSSLSLSLSLSTRDKGSCVCVLQRGVRSRSAPSLSAFLSLARSLALTLSQRAHWS